MNLYRKVERFNLTRLGIIFVLLLVMTSIGYGKRQFLSVGTAPPGGAFFVVGSAIAQVVNDNLGDLSWQVSAEATKGTQENIRRLRNGELDFALANAAISYFAVRGQGAWKEEYPVRVIMTLAPNVALFLTQRSSNAIKNRSLVKHT